MRSGEHDGAKKTNRGGERKEKKMAREGERGKVTGSGQGDGGGGRGGGAGKARAKTDTKGCILTLFSSKTLKTKEANLLGSPKGKNCW